MDDGRLSLVQPRNGVAGVAEYLQRLGLGEASLQPLIHQIDNLTPCRTISRDTSTSDFYCRTQISDSHCLIEIESTLDYIYLKIDKKFKSFCKQI